VNDTEAVVAAALDYFEGWYDADLARVDRALHPQLVKRWAAQAGGENPTVTTKEMMLDFVRRGGGVEDRTDDAIEVTVVDIHHDIAAAVVRSAQYREYLHLLRTSGGWRIVNAFWELTEPDQQAPG
jgi:putative lumazine-binding protein